MVGLHYSVRLDYEILGPQADFIFNIHAARTAHQTVAQETLSISPERHYSIGEDGATHQRLLRLSAASGALRIAYQADVEIQHHIAIPDEIPEVPVADLPSPVLPYLYPSRYCESDKLQALAHQTFGHLPPAYARVQAIRDWVEAHVRFQSGSSNVTTSALDTLAQASGVCRDYAHLMIALCRALNIPARFASAIDFGADPALGPTDFHAYVEVFLGGRWYIFDPSGSAIPMGFIRIGTGRDAADSAFATIFGTIRSGLPVLSITAQADAAQGYVPPQHCAQALSTDMA